MTVSLPVIVGFGGYNAAGRSSSHQAFRRMVLDSLSPHQQEQTIVGLACLMGHITKQGTTYQNSDGQLLTSSEVCEQYRESVLSGTLIRKVKSFDPSSVPGHKKVMLGDNTARPVFTIAKRDLPRQLPDNWQLNELNDGTFEVSLDGKSSCLLEASHELAAKAAGELPDGFKPSEHYNSRFHPRGLQLALLGASDALHSVGIPWQQIADAVNPDQIGVYSSSGFGQVQDEAMGGLLKARLRGERTTAKQLPLSLNSMPADFINAYVLGSVGHTEAITGACATFLYGLQAAVRDIRSGKRKVAIVGNAEAELTKLGKAGRSRWKGVRPQTRGVAMNPVDHPLGGGEGKSSGGRVPVSPWGKPEKKTRKKKKYSNKSIVRGRSQKGRN